MSVSSVNSGFGPNQFAQSAVKSAVPQRANANTPASASASAEMATAVQNGSESVVAGLGSPTLHANRVGVAAYAAIMNPQTSTSMRTEA